MKQENTRHEKAKPFRLVKYFTLTSLLVIFAGTIVLSLLNTRWARNLQLRKSEDYALVLIENISHQIFLRFVIPVALKYGKIQLRDPEQYEHMDKIIRSTLYSFPVDMLTIYDKSNVISYSFDSSMIGLKNIGGTGYQNAVSGKTNSKLVQRGGFWGLLLGFPEESKLITYAPIRAEKTLSRLSGPVLGVIEIVQDISDDDETIFTFQVYIIATCTLVMGLLFLVLLFLVQRGEKFFEIRALERIKLKEQLSRAEHLSTLGEMVAGISHEIRNPLGIIRSSAEHLKKKVATLDPENPFPNIIVEEASRLNTILTDFLSFAKPRDPNFHPCKIEDIIDKNILFLNSQTREQNYLIEKKIEQNLPKIEADSEMLHQAFLNIFINAMHAMPEGGTIRIEIISNAQQGCFTIKIADQGHGIPESIKERIWDPFFTTKEKGTGLGLVIVKNIVESHGGAIKIDNLPDHGACVAVELPITQNQRN